MPRSKHVSILGAGQCGTLLAIMFARRGFSIELYERNSDPRGDAAAAGRSINLALAARGFNALEKAGVLPVVEPLLVPMRGRRVHAVDGATEFLLYLFDKGAERERIRKALGIVDAMTILVVRMTWRESALQEAVDFDCHVPRISIR